MNGSLKRYYSKQVRRISKRIARINYIYWGNNMQEKPQELYDLKIKRIAILIALEEMKG